MRACARIMLLIAAAPFAAAGSETWTEAYSRGLRMHAGGNYGESVAAFEAAVRLASDAREKALALNNLGSLYHEIGRCPEAIGAVEGAFHIWVKRPDEGPVARTAVNLQSVLVECGHMPEAEHIDRKFIGPTAESDPDLAPIIVSNRAAIALYRRQYSKAEDLSRRSVALMEQSDSSGALTAIAHGNLSIVLIKRRKFEEALVEAQRSCDLLERVPFPPPSVKVRQIANRAWLEHRLGRLTEARTHYAHAIEIATGSAAVPDGITATVLEDYADVAAALKDTGEAKDLKRQAKAVRGRMSLQPAGQTVDVLELTSGGR